MFIYDAYAIYVCVKGGSGDDGSVCVCVCVCLCVR